MFQNFLKLFNGHPFPTPRLVTSYKREKRNKKHGSIVRPVFVVLHQYQLSHTQSYGIEECQPNNYKL